MNLFTNKLGAAIEDQSLGGLCPRVWICVGPGFSREDVKEFLLKNGQGFTSDVVINLAALCSKIIAAGAAPGTPVASVLSTVARQEVLRMLLADSRINGRTPELKRLRRQSGFYKKLDRSIQAGRLAFAHPEEQMVYAERLEKKINTGPIRAEVELLARAYEAWLSASVLSDPPLQLGRAAQVLEEGACDLRWPEKIFYFTAIHSESLEERFWDELKKVVIVEKIGPLQSDYPPWVKPLRAEQWHTLDDAAEALADCLQEAGVAYAEQAVLMPDIPKVRRVLTRVFENRGLRFSDPRDPTRLKWEESIKWALLPLELVSRGFERTKVISFLRSSELSSASSGLVREINERGIRNGLNSYSGGKLAPLYALLEDISLRFGGRKSCAELAAAHLKALATHLEKRPDLQWVYEFFETLWEEFKKDISLIGDSDLRAPLLYWLERLSARLDEATPPVEKSKNQNAVQLFRLGQAPLEVPAHLWCFGLSASWLSGEGVGDYWYSGREREFLASEFSVRSSVQIKQERVSQLKSWFFSAENIRILDAEYDWDGRQREPSVSLFKELAIEITLEAKGAHPKWSPSYGALRPVSALSFRLPPLDRKDIRATELDRYSRCTFQGLGAGRWKLWDHREPDTDLWPDVRGNILHAALKILIEARGPDGNFTVSPEDALEQGWQKVRPTGLLRGERLARYTKQRLRKTVDTFCEKERDYFIRSATQILSLEGPPLRLQFPDFNLVGIPDRVDEHPEGVFVMDYKTSTALPSGSEMVYEGYRLQLPFYALAASRHFSRPAVGVQFVELATKGGRGHGIFFKKFNGKEPGKLTHSRSKLNVLDVPPEEVWSLCESQLLEQGTRYYEGFFEVKPKKQSECRSCGFRDLCGQRRIGAVTLEVSDE